MINISPTKLSWILRAIPNFLWPLKFFITRASLKKTGNHFRFGSNCTFSDHRKIEIGDNVFMGDYSVIAAIVPVKIGNNVMFGPEVMIMGGDHNMSVVGKPMRFVHSGGRNIPIEIEDDVWIGARALILKGVKIGEGSVVGAGSLVTKPLPPYSVNVGSPCKTLRCRFSKKDLEEHLRLVNSKYTIEQIEKYYNDLNLSLE
jgi:acetyltransferase-like isoleucine patch superfamily enzyme